MFEAVFPLLNPFARIPVCGLISMYNATSLSPGPILLPHLMRAILTKRLTFRGFIVSDFFGRYGDFMHDVSAWVGEGRIKYREDVVEGLKNAPRALIGLLRGENFVSSRTSRARSKPGRFGFCSTRNSILSPFANSTPRGAPLT